MVECSRLLRLLIFTRLLAEYLSDDECLKLQLALAKDPEAGPVIVGSGGVRKIRCAISGRGTRGGLRDIYDVRSGKRVIWRLTPYPKNVAENIPTHILRAIRREIEDE